MSNPTIDKFGDQHWRNADGSYHREDGPAIIYNTGSQEWYLNDELHRTDGPAIVWADGSKAWWVNGSWHKSNKQFQKAANLSDEEMTLLILKYGNVK